MNLFDIIVVALCTIFLVRGVWVGFIRQISFIAALALGYIAAGRFYGEFSHFLDPFIANRQLSFLVIYFILFIAVYVFVILAGILLRKVIQISFLGWFDRLLGGIFGLAKGLFLVHILFMVLSVFLSPSSTLIRQSLLYPYIKESTQILLSIIRGEEIQNGFLPKEPAIEEILPQGSLPPVIKPGQYPWRNTEKKSGNE